MSSDLTPAFARMFAGKLDFGVQIRSLHVAYKTAAPFPHVVIDDLFDPSLLEPILSEIAAMRSSQWHHVERESFESVLRMRSPLDMGPAGTSLFNLIQSAAFMYFVSEITGIWQLLPDPYLQGAGYATMHRGGFFKVHSDRSTAYETGLTRRLAMIIFLNKEWKTEYNGQLELWSPDAYACVAKIEPIFNRTIIFEVADPNYHGVPTPLTCPEDRSRQSLIIYYHTVGKENAPNKKPHGSVFAPEFYRDNSISMRKIILQWTPPILSKALRRARLLTKRKSNSPKKS